jgi:hypothetical protein
MLVQYKRKTPSNGTPNAPKYTCIYRHPSKETRQSYTSLPPPPLINSLPQLLITIISLRLSNQQLLPPIQEPPLSLNPPLRNRLQHPEIIPSNRFPELRPHTRRVKLTTRLTSPTRPITRQDAHLRRDHARNRMLRSRKRPYNLVIAVFAHTHLRQRRYKVPRTKSRPITTTITQHDLTSRIVKELARIRAAGA